ncbi:MAG: hypothetical protein HKN16_07045 [Saprospiraceae bacterium]|nr:hypothetical protein [Saprospiraceae bacterium]
MVLQTTISAVLVASLVVSIDNTDYWKTIGLRMGKGDIENQQNCEHPGIDSDLLPTSLSSIRGKEGFFKKEIREVKQGRVQL